MSKPNETWTVLPHGKLEQLDDNIWTVTGQMSMPIGDFPRRMTVVRLASGGLLIFSAIALDEAEMHELLALGEPSFLVVPCDRHRMDVKPWKERFPRMRVIAPPGARKKVEELVPVDDTAPDLGDPRVELVTMPGTDGHEAALRVRSASGTTIIINELVFNVPSKPGFGGWLFDLMGMTGREPHVPGVVKMRDVKDPAALAQQLSAWAHEDVKRIVVSHGNVIAANAPEVLARIAHDLAA